MGFINKIEWIIIGVGAAYIALLALVLVAAKIKKYSSYRRLNKIRSSQAELTPEEFFQFRKEKFGTVGKGKYLDFGGVYILFNTTRNLHYVGQAKRVIDRVNNHLTGKGNGDVYADYKYGDRFVIRMIDLSLSGAKNLNELERVVIAAYDSYSSGYNKTRGNR